MKALVKFAPGPGNVDVLDVEEPSCGPSQVKVGSRFLWIMWNRHPCPSGYFSELSSRNLGP